MFYDLMQTRRRGLIGEFEPPALIEKFKSQELAKDWLFKRGYKWDAIEQGYVQGSMTQYMVTINEIAENPFALKSLDIH
jgi:hypothetical protein